MAEQIKDHVEHIADSITNPPEPTENEFGETEGDAMDWLSDVLDIQWIVDRDKQYLGARVLVAFGGPNIWVNTLTKTVEGYWWMDKAFAPFQDNLGLDDALCELYNC